MSARSVSLAFVWPILALPALVSGMVGYHTAGLRYNETHSFCASDCRADDVYYTSHGEACFMRDAYADEDFTYCKGGKVEPPPDAMKLAASDCSFLPDEKIRVQELDGKLVPRCSTFKSAVDTDKYPEFETHQQVVEALKALTEPKTEKSKTEELETGKTKAAKPTEFCYGPDDCRPTWD